MPIFKFAEKRRNTMKNTRRVLSVVLCMLLMVAALTVCQVGAAFAATDGDYTYTVTKENTVTITAYAGTDATITVPATLGGYSVTAIGNKAFVGCTATAVVLPADVTVIGNAAFQNCAALKSITMPTAYTVGDAAFLGCAALEKIDLNGAESIGVNALAGCNSLTELTVATVGAAQGNVGYMATLFGGIANPTDPGFPATLASVTVTNDTSIEASVFAGMKDLVSVTFNKTVTALGANAFNGCAALENLNFTVKAGTVGAKAFYGCKALKAINISDSKTTQIGASAFEGCTALETVTAGANLNRVGKNAFKNTKWMANQADGAVLLQKVYITNKGNAQEIVVPAEAAYIADSAWQGNKNVVSVEIPGTVQYVGTNVLTDTNVAAVKIPYMGAAADGKTAPVLSYLFGGEDAKGNAALVPQTLVNVELTGGVVVPASAFADCRYLMTVSIPSTITEVRSGAFANCTSLVIVGYDAAKATVATDAFSGTAVETIIFGEHVQTIPTYLCTANSNLTALEIPESVTRIETGAFNGCYNVESVVYNAVNCTYVASDAFDYCHKLSEIKLGKNVKHIPANLFSVYGGSGLTELTISENVTSIAPGAFANCVSLKTLNYNADGCTIGDGAFSACTKLENINIGTNVTAIPKNLYTNNPAIVEVTVPDNITYISEFAFSGCTALKEITIPETLTKIGANILAGTQWYDMQPEGPVYLDHIFYGYKGAMEGNSIELNYGTVGIAGGAFKGNGALKSVVVPSTVTAIGDDAFEMSNAIIILNNPDASKAIIDFANEHGITCDLAAGCAHTNTYYVIAEQATATANGTLEQYCKDCEEKIGTESYAGAADLADKWVMTEAPTCTEIGALEMGDALASLPATDHKFVTWKQTQAPTCAAEGVTGAFCSECGEIEDLTGSIEKLPHTAGDWEKLRLPRTYCTGLNGIMCTECGELLKSKVLPKLEEGSPLDNLLDVPDKAWYRETVAFVMNNDLFNGVDEISFGPDKNMTRAMFVTVLGRLAGVEVDNNVKTAFTDIKKNQYYTGYVKWAAENGIVNGVSSTKFAPNADITREQICTMIVRYCKYAEVELDSSADPALFRDADAISKYAFESVLLCNKAGIVKGRGNNTFAPKANATRAEVAQVLKNLCLGYLVVE